MTAWLVLALGVAHAQHRLPNQQDSMDGPATGFGLGAVVGPPHGLAMSWRPSPAQAVQATLGFGGTQGRFAINTDYIRTVWAFFADDQAWVLPLYMGAGVRVRTDTEDSIEGGPGEGGFGVRAPIGLRVYPEDVRLDIYIETAPALHFSPSPVFTMDFALGVRLWAGGKQEH